FSFLGHCDLREAPPGERLPPLVVDSHNIDYELARQYARAGGSLARRLYYEANWRKLRREELRTDPDAAGGDPSTPPAQPRPPGPARRSFPTRRTSGPTSRAPRTRRRTAALWSSSGSSPTSPMLTA